MRCIPEETLARLRGEFATRFGDSRSEEYRPFAVASAPGRVELAGNHTDHQGGRTVSAAIDRRAYALAAENGTDEIRVFMDGFGFATMRTCELDARPDEQGTPLSLIRGMVAAFAASGKPFGGFDMVTRSDIPVGSGVSSSAAFEVLIGAAIRTLFDPAMPERALDAIGIALEGVQAERIYFGKPCGAQDQIACALGGVVGIDFSSEVPQTTPIAFDADAFGYTLVLVDSACDHSSHTGEFAAVAADMHAVAHHFARERLEEVPFAAFLGSFSRVREALGDRAALRALHYFEETRRVHAQQEALMSGDFERFLEYVRLSGASSAQILQNVFPANDSARTDQPAAVVLALCAHLLDGDASAAGYRSQSNTLRGAYRIHGGGFGGSALAFVPEPDAGAFIAAMNDLLGYDACTSVTISSLGVCGTRIGL